LLKPALADIFIGKMGIVLMKLRIFFTIMLLPSHLISRGDRL